MLKAQERRKRILNQKQDRLIAKEMAHAQMMTQVLARERAEQQRQVQLEVCWICLKGIDNKGTAGEGEADADYGQGIYFFLLFFRC